MNENDVISFIKTAQESGKIKEGIYQELLGQSVTLDQIERAYDSLTKQESKAQIAHRTNSIILSIAGILVALGVFSFVASNWYALPAIIKVFIIILSSGLFYFLGYIAKNKDLLKTGRVLTFVATLIFGAGIFLIGQIFNLSKHWADGFLLWMLGSLAVAWAEDSYEHYILGLFTGIAGVIGLPFSWFSDDSLFSGFSYAGSLFLLLVALGISFYLSWISNKKVKQINMDIY